MIDYLKNKVAIATVAVGSAVCAFAQEAGATTPEAAMTEVSEKFQELITSAIPIIIGLIGAAIGIYAIFAGVRWLKKALKAGSN